MRPGHSTATSRSRGHDLIGRDVEDYWAGWGAVTTDVVALVVMTAVLLPLGWWLFPLGIEKARRNGTLTRWN